MTPTKLDRAGCSPITSNTELSLHMEELQDLNPLESMEVVVANNVNIVTRHHEVVSKTYIHIL